MALVIGDERKGKHTFKGRPTCVEMEVKFPKYVLRVLFPQVVHPVLNPINYWHGSHDWGSVPSVVGF